MNENSKTPTADAAKETAKPAEDAPRPGIRQTQPPGEIGGPKGPEPTRYGDWEKNGICSDF